MNKFIRMGMFIASCLLISKMQATTIYMFENKTGFNGDQLSVQWTDANKKLVKKEKFNTRMVAPKGAVYLTMFVTVGNITNGFMDKVPNAGTYRIELHKAGNNGFAAVQTACCETEGCTLRS